MASGSDIRRPPRARQARGPAPHGHLVFLAKYRRGVPDDDIPRYCEQVMRTACRDSETDLREFTGQAGHVHLPGNYPPKVSVPALANSLTGVSARMPRSQYPGRVNRARTSGHFWSPSCLAASRGGAPPSIIRRSIDQQQRPA